jgi:transcriptional regulator with XRE-family HTH domain
MTEPRSFGAWLRREREARSIPLRSIADRTKIGAGLLEGLERGDLSRWPGGIYRRAFVRAYAEAVGLDGDRVIANFERAFPPDPALAIDPSAGSAPVVPVAELRLSLATPAANSGVNVAIVKTAARDLACVALAGVVGYAFGGATSFWAAAALLAIGFHLSRVFGVNYKALVWTTLRREAAKRQDPAPQSIGSIVDFPARSARVRRARRLLADLSAAATSAALPGRRRAARS